MQNTKASNLFNLITLVLILTCLDFVLGYILFNNVTIYSPILIVSFIINLILLFLLILIIRVVFKSDVNYKVKYRGYFIVSFILITVNTVLSLLIYLLEMITVFGLLDKPYLEINLKISRDLNGELKTLFEMVFLVKFFYNLLGLITLFIITLIWIGLFRILYNFSTTSFIKPMYFAGLSGLILFFDQLTVVIVQFSVYWFLNTSDITEYPISLQILMFILFLSSIIVLAVYIYLLASASEYLRIKPLKNTSKSKLRLIIPLFFLTLWVLVNLTLFGDQFNVGFDVINLLGMILPLLAYLPISIGFISCGKKMDSIFIKQNLFVAGIAVLALSFFNVVGFSQWNALSVFSGYLISFAILFWSLANISQYLSSREGLSKRLQDTGFEFLSALGEADRKAETFQKMANALSVVSKGFLSELNNKQLIMPPSDEEIRSYIVSIMGTYNDFLTKDELIDYVNKAMVFVDEKNK